MPRPKNFGAIDLMLELPGTGDMGVSAARRLTRDKGSKEFTNHPAEYMFKNAGGHGGGDVDPEAVLEMMDLYGVQMAQIAVSPRAPGIALEMIEKHPTRFFGEVYVDPNRGMEAVRDLELGASLHPNIRAFSLMPCLMSPQVPIDDKRVYPLYAKCIELDLAVNCLVGVPGPRVPFKCQHPELIDEVAWFFPELKFVMRHGGDPWTDLCVKLLLKWPNVYYSTSAWAPKHYPRNVLDFANKRGREKVMFAGYYPTLPYDRIFSEMDDLPLKDETWQPFLRDNAMRVYGLDKLLAAPEK
ncbi:amidohydrolase family protein [Sphingopyxis terrae]|uniref:amidohydrolase family protein n=1 Tax=Sphingopyxis terrae TaxID=33052 RepID=UPI002A126C81|nr:amidohydrolase family protein [Sphingopyxis terrae]MDX8356433.1 amidohydrolase family protein [Sphingopyxis terrae]